MKIKKNMKTNLNPMIIPIIGGKNEPTEPHNSSISNLTDEIELLGKRLSIEEGNKENLENIGIQEVEISIKEPVKKSVEEHRFGSSQQPQIIYEKVSVPLHFQSSIEAIFNWNDILSYRNFLNAIEKFYSRMDFETKKQWKYSIRQARLQMKEQVSYLKEYVNKGVYNMNNIEKIARDIFLEDLQRLGPLEKFAVSDLVDSSTLSNLMEEIRAEIKNGIKVSYKLTQQLQMQLEEFQHKEIDTVQLNMQQETPHGSIISQQQLIDLTQEIEKLKQRQKLSINTMIKAIDMLDLIKNSAVQLNLETGWVEQIKHGIQTYLQELEKLDIQEIEALGKIIDGRYMISIGNVPKEAAPNYEKFEVCIVHERGFIEASTGKIIREAKVLSVY